MGLAAARMLHELGANVYTICRRNGRHSELDFPVAGELYADFGVKEDLDVLAEALPVQIDAMFLCHGIALKADASNALEVQKVNFLGHKYLLEKILPRIADNGSVSIIASTGGFGWQGVFDECAAVVNAPEYISRRIRLNAINSGNTLTGLTDDFNRNTSPNGDAAEGKAVIEKIFLSSWNGRWASAEEMGYPLVAIGSQIFSYMSGQIIYFDYGMSSVWETDALSKN